MPYIKQQERDRFENLVKSMHLTAVLNAGELNYLITQLVHSFLETKARSYQNYNDALGALEGAKLELYRQHIAKYEDVKIALNGDVP